MLRHHYLRLLTALLCLVTLSAVAADAIDFARVDPADHQSSDWYLDSIDGRPVGYWHTALGIKDNTIVTTYEQVRYESHGGELLKTRDLVKWIESLDYQPLVITVQKESGSDKITQTYRFTSDGIELTSEQNGRSIKRQLPPIEGDYLTNAQQAIATELYLKQGEQSFEFTTLDPLVSLTPYKTRYQRSDKPAEPLKQPGDTIVNASPWTVSYSILPGFEMQVWVDAQARQVAVAYDIGGMMLSSILTDESVKQIKFDPPEMAGLSVVVPDRPIKLVNRQRRIVYELSYSAGESQIVPATTAQQRVEKLGEGRVQVTVDLDAKPADKPTDADRPTSANLAASIMIDHEDREVKKLAKLAVKKLDPSATTQQIAEACKRTVSKHITGTTLAVGGATASEAARTGKGDCTESAVLLAALLRAHQIPSRCVTGLVYSEDPFAGQANAFVYHMWTQAWIATDDNTGRWIDLDSAMWRYSAGHIALGVSNMGDNDQDDLIRIVPMMQDLKIKIIDIAPGDAETNANNKPGVQAEPETDG